ncbi:FxsA family protein [Sulfitobacter sp. D35]|uniref:FxsA family protein n=1 Tax=Sulfitobacter sp. D35 TaxID=3083252 RepID=UPI00296E6BD0|nr:FxsA family protein [Sulfitobacter sp. D35]MDW4498081.1 FxsA family protein [Sulfitobacter sp. D35]
MWLFLIFIAVPLIEIALFIQVGGLIGLGWTLFTVVVTAILGTWLVRTQGLAALDQLKTSFNEMRDPSEPLAHGAMILFSGALLLTPGFFTDAIGFALLVPAIRSAAFQAIRSRVRVTSFQSGSVPPHREPRRPVRPRDDVIEGDYTEVPPKGVRPTHDGRNGGSGWTKH